MDKEKNNNILCTCKKEFNITLFKKTHYKECQAFKNKFKEFDLRMVTLLKKFIVDNEDFYLVKFLLTGYIKLINKMINDYNKKIKEMENDTEKYNDHTTKDNEKEIVNIKEEKIVNKENINNKINKENKEDNLGLNNDNRIENKNIFNVFLKDNISNRLKKNNDLNLNNSIYNNINIENPYDYEKNNKGFNACKNDSSKFNNNKSNNFNNTKKKKSFQKRRELYPEIKKKLKKLNEEDFFDIE